MSNTEVADYLFTVKEGEPSRNEKDDAPVWLMCEPMTHELSIVGDKAFLGIRLKPEVTIAEAKEIARYLKDHIVGISYTKL